MGAPLAYVIDDDPEFRASLEPLVKHERFEVRGAGTLAELRALVQECVPDVFLVDLELPDGDGLEFIREQSEQLGPLSVVVITGHASVDSAVAAIRGGALDYLTKPLDRARLKSVLKNVMRTRLLNAEVADLRGELRELGRFGSMIGRSEPMQQVFDMVARVAPTDASVLITGESGTGKELVAETIHQLSQRRDKRLCPINCGAVSPTLIESELFGHERGSFTGANRTREGYFELAHEGTLFLDEVTEMPMELQVKLLRVLETGKILRVGGGEHIEVDVRVIASTNRVPLEAVQQGRLREDLFYRLNVFPIDVPPLRRRQGDVELLAQHFLDELNRAGGTHKTWSPVALERLKLNPWRGNVRELKNAVSRAYIMAGDSAIVPAQVVPAVEGVRETASGDGPPSLTLEVGKSIAEVEKKLILATLREFGGDKLLAARTLGISLKTLYNRLNVYAASVSEQD
jgi:two-component system response regulator AtoC